MRNDYAQLQEGTDAEVAKSLETAFDYVSAIDWIEGGPTRGEEDGGEFEATPGRQILTGFGTSRDGIRSITIDNTRHTAEDARWLAREAVTSCIERFEQNAGWKLVGAIGEERIEPEERLQLRDPANGGDSTPFWIHRNPTKSGTRTTLRRVENRSNELSANWPGAHCRVGPAAKRVIRKLGEWNASQAAERETAMK